MTVAARVATGAAVLILLLTAALSYHLAVVRRLATANRTLSTQQVQLIVLTLDEMDLLDRIDESARKLAVTGDAGYAKQLAERAAAFAEGLSRMSSFELADAEVEAVAALRAVWVRFKSEQPPTDTLLAATAPGERRRLLAPSLEHVAALRRHAQALVAAANQELTQQGARAVAAQRASERLALAVFAAALAFGGGAVVLSIRAIQRPLRRLIAAAARLAEEEYDLKLDDRGSDELSRLAAAFNDAGRRLAELDEMKRNLLSHVSHELRTPLANVQESHQLLLDGLTGPLTAEQRHLLELNLGSCDRLERLISNLLERSRLDAGAAAYDFAEVDLREAVRTAVAELGGRAEESGVRLEVELPPRPLRLNADRERLVQVLENLLENAIKYSSAGGCIALSARAVATLPAELPERWRGAVQNGSRFALVEVADEGRGVPPQDREKIFDRFYRSQRGSGGPSGVGLGLAICRDLVAAHGGAIWVSDNTPVGSRFHVLLPAAPPAEGAPEAPR